MGLFGQQEYDRTRILEDAARARAKKRRRKAVALYRQVLAVEPENADLHGKLAPLLAETGQRFDAWLSFRTAARACVREERVERALALYREAARLLPGNLDVWCEMAALQRKRGREREAMQTLLEGRLQFRRRRQRPQAIYLLRRAREIEPWRPGTILDLSRLLAKMGQEDEALMLLKALAVRSEDEALRRVCAAQFRILPSFGHAWQWLRAAAQTRSAGAGRRSRASALLRLSR